MHKQLFVFILFSSLTSVLAMDPDPSPLALNSATTPQLTVRDIIAQYSAANAAGNGAECERLLAIIESGDYERYPLPNSQDELNKQLLSVATTTDIDRARKLVVAGADVNAVKNDGTTVLMNAADSKDDNGKTALGCAIARHNFAICALLIRAGADVDVKIDGHSALHYAAWMNDESICQLLINAGAPVNVSTSGRDRRTPLDEAIIKGNESLCKMLIDARADVNILVSENRTTPLMYSMYQSNERVCALLLEAKANVNMQASEHRTALYIAITQKDVGKCAMLIAAGADVNMKNCINSSGRAHLMDAVREGNEQMCALLLEKQADINIQDRRTNKSALSAAILQKNSGMCALLIAAGADIHAQDWCDRTAFMQSVMKGNEQICALLLAAKADLNASGGYGVPPLHGAIFLKDNAISMVRFLLEAGADLPCVYSGQRVLIRAAQFQKDSLCRLIVEHQKSRNARAAQALLFRLKRMKAEGHAAARFLYKHSHQLLQPYLKDMALRAMLAARDLHGKRAFDYLPIDVLAVEENK